MTGRGTIATDGNERPQVEQVAPKVEPREQSSVDVVRTAPIETVTVSRGW